MGRRVGRLVSSDLLREVPRERAVARLGREIIRHLGSPNPVASFFFWNRTRREVALAPFVLMRDVDVRAPYLDEDVYTLLIGLSAALQMDRQFHTEVIRKGYPGVADIPYEPRRERQACPAFHRRVAIELCRPALVATAVDGSADRLWHTSRVTYLVQLAALAARSQVEAPDQVWRRHVGGFYVVVVETSRHGRDPALVSYGTRGDTWRRPPR